jgi:single-strand DNA-binding protein
MNQEQTYQPKINFQDTARVFKVDARATASGKQVTTVTVTMSNGKDKDGNWRDSTFLDVVFWDELAFRAQNEIAKGDTVAIQGKLTSKSYQTKEGQKRTQHFINGHFFQKVDRPA